MQVPADFKLIFVPSTAVIPEVIKVCGPCLAQAFSWVCFCAHFPWVVHIQVLVKNNISSVPVMDVETNQFSGLIDMIGTERRSLVFFSPPAL